MKSSRVEYLMWASGEHRFALELAQCRELVNSVAITRLPRSPAFVLGLANLRGSVISVLDLEVLLGYRKSSPFREATNIVRLRNDGYPVALAADTISDTILLGAEDLEGAPANLSESECKFIRMVAKTKDGLVLIPDLSSITARIN